MMLEDCQDCILVGRAGHLLQTVDCNSTRTSRISIRGGGTCPVSNIHYHMTINFSAILVSLRSNFRQPDSGNILEIFSQSVNIRNIFIILGEEHLWAYSVALWENKWGNLIRVARDSGRPARPQRWPTTATVHRRSIATIQPQSSSHMIKS